MLSIAIAQRHFTIGDVDANTAAVIDHMRRASDGGAQMVVFSELSLSAYYPGDLYKTEVFALSRHVNASAGRELIPAAVLDKPPSAELAPGQRDTDSLPPYPVPDEILKWHIEGNRLPAPESAQALAFVTRLRQSEKGRCLVTRIVGMLARNEHKRRQAAPIIRVRSRAFGSGRQLPIAAHYPAGDAA